MTLMTWNFLDGRVSLNVHPLSPTYRIHIEASATDSRASNDAGIQCNSDEARRRLIDALRVADALATFLGEGGALEHWSHPAAGGAFTLSNN